jgi:regulator of protease activity HflC (stomatin/prohibitin superfamily)
MTPLIAKDRAEPDGVGAQSARIAFRFLFGAVGFIALGWAVSNIRQVQPDSWAVVLRFGNVVRQQGAGLLIAWPRPIEQIVLLPSADRQTQIRITRFEGAGGGTTGGASRAAGVRTGRTGETVPGFDMEEDPRLNAGFLLTGDSSVVHLQATLFYQISDPVAYVIAGDHVGPGLERLFIASAVSICAGRDLDTILVARPEMNQSANETLRAGREQLRSDLMKAVNRRLDDLAAQGAGFGVTVSRVDLVPAIPSNAKTEFDRVLVATQEAETTIAQARTDAELITQQANQRSDSIITDATAGAREQVSDATGRTATISALAEQSQPLNRRMLINRIYFSRVGALMAKMGSVETVDPDGGAHVILSGPQKR